MYPRDSSLRGAFFSGRVDGAFEAAFDKPDLAAGFDVVSSIFGTSFLGFCLSLVAAGRFVLLLFSSCACRFGGASAAGFEAGCVGAGFGADTCRDCVVCLDVDDRVGLG